MNLQNKIMLITYADSMGKNLKELHEVLNKYYKDAIGGVHILPFSLLRQTVDLPPCVMTKWMKHSEIFPILRKLGENTI